MNFLTPYAILLYGQNKKNEGKTVEVIVEYDSLDQCEDILKNIGKVKYKLPIINSYVIEVPVEHMPMLNKIKNVKSIHQNTHITAQMNVARKIVKADTAHRFGYTGTGTTIAILDTGIAPVSDFCHPKNRIVAFYDFVGGKLYPYDDNGHGTHVASASS